MLKILLTTKQHDTCWHIYKLQKQVNTSHNNMSKLGRFSTLNVQAVASEMLVSEFLLPAHRHCHVPLCNR